MDIYIHCCTQTNTFQAVLTSSINTSYAIFTYQCDLLNWQSYNASIGFSAGKKFYKNHFLSRQSNVNDISCLNEPYSKWSNIVYNTHTGTHGLNYQLYILCDNYFIILCAASNIGFNCACMYSLFSCTTVQYTMIFSNIYLLLS